MSAPAIRPVYRFGDFELDAAAYQLRRNGQGIHLARQPMELLLLLVEKSHDLVSRDEIARRLWPEDVFVGIVGKNRFEPGSLFAKMSGRDRVRIMFDDVRNAIATFNRLRAAIG